MKLILQVWSQNSRCFYKWASLFFWGYLDCHINDTKFPLEALNQVVNCFIISVHTFCKYEKEMCLQIRREKTWKRPHSGAYDWHKMWEGSWRDWLRKAVQTGWPTEQNQWCRGIQHVWKLWLTRLSYYPGKGTNITIHHFTSRNRKDLTK